MGTTTEFLREVSHSNYSYLLAILLTEKCHSSCLLSFLNCHYISNNRNSLCNLFINNIFNLSNLFLSHALEMCKVKS